MKEEIRSAVNFLKEHLESKSSLSFAQIELFKGNLEYFITERFENHWHPTKPLKGNAYRCLNIDPTAVDPLIIKASTASGISPFIFQEIFPDGLALWIDPMDVCCRIGKRQVIRTIYGSGWVDNKGQQKPFNFVNLTSSPYYRCSFVDRKPVNQYKYQKENILDYQQWTSHQYPYMTAQVY